MNKWIALILVFLLSLALLPASPVKAQPDSVLSLNEGMVVFPDSDVQLIAMGEENIYALVTHKGESFLFFSQNKGATWQKTPSQGLPEQERFICLKALAGKPDILALATTFGVYLSRDSGNRFEYLGGPTNLIERGEEITSLAIAKGDPPLVLVGVWHPGLDKFPQEGVYLWGLKGDHFWKEQGMRPSWQGEGYSADVSSVAFLGSAILALAAGDPDRSDPLQEGTYLNLGYPSEQSNARGEWNWPSGWPIEISSGKIQNSTLVLPTDIDERREDEWKFFVLYNSQDKSKDGIYKIIIDDVVWEPIVQRLEMPRYLSWVSLDSLVEFDGALALGITTEEKGKKQAEVYYLSKDITSVQADDWSEKRIHIPNTKNCQVLLAEKDLIYVGTSGSNSFFARASNGSLSPISLLDITGDIRQVVLSSRFPRDETLFLVYGESMLKLKPGSASQPKEVERISLPEGLNLSGLRIEAESSSSVILIEPRAGRIWLSQNSGLSWSRREVNTPTIDIKLAGWDTIWAAGKDSKIYKSENAGKTWQPGISSGIRWLQTLEVGLRGQILAAGGTTQENTFDTISLLGQGFYNLPIAGKDFEAVFSPKDNSIYCTTGGRLYKFLLQEERWEEIINLRETITKIHVSLQGLYFFANSQVYFSTFPLTPNSSWEKLKPEAKGTWLSCEFAEISQRENLLFFWSTSKIIPYYHQIPEEEPEKAVLPEPEKPAPIIPQPAETKSVEPVESAGPIESAKPGPQKPEVAKPEIPQIQAPPAEKVFPPDPALEEPKQGNPVLLVAVIVLFLIVVFLIFAVKRMWRTYRYYA